MADQADLIVVGLGAMGSAVAYHASRLGMSVIGIDRHDPPHAFGSTHAETRITRLAVGEGPQYLPFVARSHELWRTLEAELDVPLLHQCGGYIVTAPILGEDRWNDFTVVTNRIAALAGIDYSLRTPEQVRSAHPQLRLPDDFTAGYEPTAGIVMAERAVAGQLTIARRLGADIRTRETVVSVLPTADQVTVQTDLGTYTAPNVVLATGPWFEELASPELARHTKVTRQVVYWFEVDDVQEFAVDRFPFIMWIGATIDDYIGIFPIPDGATRGLKILGEQFATETTAETVDRTVTKAEIDAFYEQHVEPRLHGVRPSCLRAEVCLYTNTPDDNFLIDTDPRSERILVMSPCSGHGFKHSAALGEAVAQRLVSGGSVLNLEPFSASRFS